MFEKAAEWENLKWISDKNPTAFKAIYDFCEDPRQGKAPLLFGKSGCGKSHLLWAAAYRLTEWAAYLLPTRWAKAECERFDKAKREGTEFFQATQMPVINVIVTSGADVAHQLRDSVKDDNTSYVVDKLSHRRVQIIDLFYHSPETFDLIPILILDDIEVMKMSDWLAEELYRIIDHRYSEMMPTLMATNLSAEELRGHLGDRITRRLLDMSNPIVMK